jgi:Protein of unknown function (DUF3551)
MLGVGVLLAAPAAAQSYGNSGSPVCMQVFGPFNHIDCSYASMEQCRSLATAQAAQCIANPYSSASPRGRHHKRRVY